MECTDKTTNEKVAVICAMNINDEYEMVPMAMFFNENPYERLISPKGKGKADEYAYFIEADTSRIVNSE